MLTESGIQVAEIPPAELERMRRETLCPSERADAISYDWGLIGFGIALAGGAYPLVLAAIVLVIGATAYVSSAIAGDQYRPSLMEAVPVLFGIGLWASLCGLLALLWAGLAAAMTLPVVYLIAWSLKLQVSIVRIGAFAGGLVGFICIMPWMLSGPWFANAGVWEVALILLVGPMLTTILGQLGGAWGGNKSRAGPSVSIWKKYNLQPAVMPSPSDVDQSEASRPTNPKLQFSIRHLLWISVWLSLLLALIRVCGIPFELILPLLVGWLIFQAFTLWLGGRLIPPIIRWRERRRQARST